MYSYGKLFLFTVFRLTIAGSNPNLHGKAGEVPHRTAFLYIKGPDEMLHQSLYMHVDENGKVDIGPDELRTLPILSGIPLFVSSIFFRAFVPTNFSISHVRYFEEILCKCRYFAHNPNNDQIMTSQARPNFTSTSIWNDASKLKQLLAFVSPSLSIST